MGFRVYLRALEPEDYLITSEWRNDKEILDMVEGPKYFVSKEKERQWVLNTINDNSRMVLGICMKEDDRLIGTVNIQEFNWINHSCHVPILVGDKSAWGKGYATEARLLALKFAFEERGMNRVFALVLADNKGAIKHHEQCGYVKEGVLRQAVFKNGKYVDQIAYGILRCEFEKVYAAYCAKYGE